MDKRCLPEEFLVRMRHDLGSEYEAFLSSYEEERAMGLRRNPLKEPDKELFEAKMPFTLTPVPWSGTGYYYLEKERPGKHPLHETGVYYIQEPSAMAVAELADVKPGEYVLDICAAPGGKTTQLAGAMQGQGLLVANEIIPSRAKILAQNVERSGITNAVVLNHSPEELAERFPGFFDCIVVDAPCSGEGMFRKNPEACGEWSLEQTEVCAARQAEILENAGRMLAPGGRLIYSTCTFGRIENERQVEVFLEKHPDYALETMERYYPHRQKGEGHFAAKLRGPGERLPRVRTEAESISGISTQTKKGKRTGRNAAGSKTGKNGSACGSLLDEAAGMDAYEVFLKETFIDGKLPDFIRQPENFAPSAWKEETVGFAEKSKGTLQWFGSNLYLVPAGMVSFQGLKTERPGLHLGVKKKGRFEPSHALALAIKPAAVKRSVNFSADSPEIAGFLRGMTLPAEDMQGWCLVTADGYSLGWGKAGGGICKNHYPKGLYIR